MVGLIALGLVRVGGSAPRGEAPVDFRRQVRPLLSDRCFTCHGPDEGARKAKLRLDTREGALGPLRFGGHAVVPGDPAGSELFLRIATEHAEDRMPPADSGKSLSAEEIDVLRRWIEQGAPWEEHWAFVPPVRPAPPEVARADWPKNPIDRFVLAELEARGLTPSPEARPEELARRVAFALTGLPPSLEELDAYLAARARSPETAYERYVDHLLASQRFGEHQARDWLDAARYADTHGFHFDNRRNLWHWRQWVIDAYNANKPFDEFTLEQLAGDLLPNPTLEQRIATGFNRCTPTTGEGGLIEEEYLVKYAVDRLDTTATVWLGLTVACAQCHDHKYDPISQREFYQLFDFFDDVAEEGTDRNALVPPPALRVPTPEQAARLATIEGEIAAKEAALEGPMPAVDAEQEEWERAWRPRLAGRWSELEVRSASASNGSELALQADGSILAGGANPEREVYVIEAASPLGAIRALRLETLPHASLPLGGAGRAPNSNFVLGELELEHRPRGSAEWQRVALVAASADYSQNGFDVARAIDGDPATGWAVDGRREGQTALLLAAEPFGHEGGSELRIHLRQESAYAHHNIGRWRIRVSDDPELAPVTLGVWRECGPFQAENGDVVYRTEFAPELAMDCEGLIDLGAAVEGAPAGWVERPEYADGKLHEFRGDDAAIYLHRVLESASERTLLASFSSDDALKVWLNGVPVLERNVQRALTPDQDRALLELRPGANQLLLKVVNYKGGFGFAFRVLRDDAGGLPPGVERALALDAAQRSAEERKAVRDHYRAHRSEEWRAGSQELEALRKQRAALEAAIPATMVMADRPEPRRARILRRGAYDQPGEEVEPGTPAALSPFPADAPRNRLGLARWLVDPAHPLTARVTVNRIWQRWFGQGLVRTSEDFGAQGEPPSHPALLDWLARELVESGWDQKHIHRLIATSSVFRQSSRATPAAWAADPANRLLARGPRHRLDAEEIRDLALALAGLLVERVGGESVKPWQPPGLWEVVAYPTSNTATFVPDSGSARYRRSLYTFWKRTAPPPSMLALDAPMRESCSVRRSRTNTPLQALVLLNDEQFVEAARAFAQRVLAEEPACDASALRLAFRLATARLPDAEEERMLADVLEAARAEYSADPAAAEALLSIGESERAAGADSATLAAWTNLTGLVLNLDETITQH